MGEPFQRCKGCNAPIIWMDTEGKRRIPVDFEERFVGVKSFNNKTMIAHFATCPKAAKFRKDKNGKS
jgi:hypothetical protein